MGLRPRPRPECSSRRATDRDPPRGAESLTPRRSSPHPRPINPPPAPHLTRWWGWRRERATRRSSPLPKPKNPPPAPHLTRWRGRRRGRAKRAGQPCHLQEPRWAPKCPPKLLEAKRPPVLPRTPWAPRVLGPNPSASPARRLPRLRVRNRDSRNRESLGRDPWASGGPPSTQKKIVPRRGPLKKGPTQGAQTG